MQSGDRQSNAQSEVTPGVMLLNDGCAHMPICTDGIVYIYTLTFPVIALALD